MNGGYLHVIERQVDLHTILSNIVEGTYTRTTERTKSIDHVVLSILKGKERIGHGIRSVAFSLNLLFSFFFVSDIYLCFYNCMLFNGEGSVAHRIAETYLRRIEATQAMSFDHLLSQHVKDGILTFLIYRIN